MPRVPRPRRLPLTVSSPGEPDAEAPGRIPYLPWLVAALAWSAGAAVLGLAAVAVLVVAGWLTALRVPATAALRTAGQGWLAVHGVAVDLGPMHLQMMPLLATGVLVAACAVVGHHAAVQAEPGADAAPATRWRTGALVVAVCTAVYAVACAVLAALVASPEQALAVLPGAGAVALLGSSHGALRGLRLDPLDRAPAWVRRLPAATGWGLVALAVGSLVAVGVSLVAHGGRVAELHQALAPDAVGAVLLVLTQALFLPNVVLWAGSWVLGAGVTFGPGTVVTPGVTSVGALPGVPLFGLVPAVGSPAQWSWLVVGVAAGVAAAWRLLRDGDAADPDAVADWPWQGAVAGAATALVWVALAWLSRGDLGTGRLVGLGPAFPEIVWLALFPLTLAGGATGLVRHLRATRDLPEPESSDGEPAELVTTAGQLGPS